ncbi:MAG: protein kinase [Deltaproteobacteria bacterium]
MSRERMHTFEPQTFGDYVLHDRIGAGGMAEIFLATARGIEGFEKRLVIKRILPTLSDDEQFVRMFIEEAKLCVALRHPNIVQVYDLGEIDLQYFIAMEYVDGRDLLKTLAACGKKKIGFPTDIALYIVMEVLKGLDYAHKLSGPDGQPLGIIHRDVSPSNVLLSFEGEVKIGDFGIAKASTREKTATGILKGKFGYMAPEQVTGAPIDHKADIFAVGIVLYELLTGHRLFAGKNDLAVLERVRDAVIDPPPRFYREDLDPELEQIVLRALSRDPRERFESSTQLHDALHDYVYRSRALIGPAHLGRFMQSLFLSDPEELRKRNRIALPLFGMEVPEAPAPSDARMMPFGPEATEDDRGRTFSDVNSLEGDFDEKTPLADPSFLDDSSELSSQVAIIEDASSFERDYEEVSGFSSVAIPREPSSPTQNDPEVSPQALDPQGTADTKRRDLSRTARTDVSDPSVQVADEDIDAIDSLVDGADDVEVDPDRTDAELSAVDEARALRAAREENHDTDYELDKQPRFKRPTSRRVSRARNTSRAGSAIDTALEEGDLVRSELDPTGPSSGRSFSPAEIVERTVSSLQAEEDLTSEVEPTVRFDSSILPAARTDSTRVPMPQPLDSATPPLTDEYPELSEDEFKSIDDLPAEIATSQFDGKAIELLEDEERTNTDQAAPILTDSTDAPDPIVQPVDSDDMPALTEEGTATELDVEDETQNEDVLVTALGREPSSLDVEDETLNVDSEVEDVTDNGHLETDDTTDNVEMDETELTAELEEEVRLALARDRDFVAVIDTETIPDPDADDEDDATPAPLPERRKKPSRRRPISGRRPRPVLLPSDTGRDNLARRPSTRSVLPRRQSPRRRIATRASLSVVNPREDSVTKSGVQSPADRDETGRGALVRESTVNGKLAEQTQPEPVVEALPNRRASSGVTAALDEAARIDDEIEMMRRSSSVATHEPTALGMLADALDGHAQLPEPEIDFDPEEPTQDSSHLRDAIMRRQSRKRMVTRSVVLYSEDGSPIQDEMNAPFGPAFEGSDLSAPAITSAGQLEDPEASDLFGALSVLDEVDDGLGFGDDDVSFETMSKAEARPSVSLDERQAIPVPPTQPNPVVSRGVSMVDAEEFTSGGPATTRGPLPEDDDELDLSYDEPSGVDLSFDANGEETAPVEDGQVISISQLISAQSGPQEPDVIELGGHDSLDAPNPSSVSISFGSMSVSVAGVDDVVEEPDEFTTVNEEEGEHYEQIQSLRADSLIANEATVDGHSGDFAGLEPMSDLPTDDQGGLLVSESFDFGVEEQASLRSAAQRRPSPTAPPPPVRPVSMVQAPGGVETGAGSEEAPVRSQRPNNVSALRAVVERNKRPVREKNRASPQPSQEIVRASPTGPRSPMGSPVRAVGTPGVRAAPSVPMQAARGSVGDAYPPIAQVQVRRTSVWTTVMYFMVGIAVVLAVAAAVSSILLKKRNAVPIAPLQPNEQTSGAPPTELANAPGEAPDTPANDETKALDDAPKDDAAPKSPEETEPTKDAMAAKDPPAEEKADETPTSALPPPPATKPPPPAPKRVVRKAPPPAPKRTVRKAPPPKRKKRVRRRRARAPSSKEAALAFKCDEPTDIYIPKIGKFNAQTKLTKSVPPGDYRVTFIRDGKRMRSSLQVMAGKTLDIRCP